MASSASRPSDPIARLPRRMLPTDAVFWFAEEASPGMRSAGAALLLLKRAPDSLRLRAVVERAVRETPRLRQKVVESPFHLRLPEWVEDPHMDLDYHLRREAVASPGDEAQLLAHAAVLLASPLDHARPLWEMHVIEGLQGGRAAVLFKFHHSLMDGVGSLALLDRFTEKNARGCWTGASPRPLAFGLRLPPAVALARDLTLSATAVARDAASAVLHPLMSARRAARLARGAVGLIRDLNRTPIQNPIAEGAAGISRRIDRWEVSLSDLHRVSAATRATINDLVLTAVSGAVGRYHALRGVRMHTLHAMVPVNLREESARHLLGNHVGMLNVELPVGQNDPARRLAYIQARTGAAKRDRRSALYPFLTRVVTMLPAVVFREILKKSVGRTNLLCTNVPGSEQRIWLAGREVQAFVPLAPVVEGSPLSIALFSYGDKLEIGITTDPEAIPDPDKLRAHLADAFEETLTLGGALKPKSVPSHAKKCRGRRR